MTSVATASAVYGHHATHNRQSENRQDQTVPSGVDTVRSLVVYQSAQTGGQIPAFS